MKKEVSGRYLHFRQKYLTPTAFRRLCSDSVTGVCVAVIFVFGRFCLGKAINKKAFCTCYKCSADE